MSFQAQNNQFLSHKQPKNTLSNPKNFLVDFQTQRAFISRQKQWLNSIKKPQSINNNSNFDKIYQNITIDPQKSQTNKILNQQIDESLAKTVKHTSNLNKKINSSYHAQNSIISKQKAQNFSFYNPQQTVQKVYQTSKQNNLKNHLQEQNKKIIMSIEQIQRQQKSMGGSMIHRITSSSSRKKLKNSSSKDSKQSDFSQKQSNKTNKRQQKYNKYLQNQLINIHIDLRNDIVNNPMSTYKPSSVNPQFKLYNNLADQPIQVIHKQTSISDKSIQRQKIQLQRPKSNNINYKDQYILQSSRESHMIQINQQDLSQCGPLSCRQNNDNSGKKTTRQLKPTRSKSNLSKYSQLRYKEQDAINQIQQIKTYQKQKISHQDKGLFTKQQRKLIQKQSDLNTINQKIRIPQTPTKNTKQLFNPISRSNLQKKVHLLCYSSKKNTDQKVINSKQPISLTQRRYSHNLVENNLITLTQPHQAPQVPVQLTNTRKSDFIYEKNQISQNPKVFHHLNNNHKTRFENQDYKRSIDIRSIQENPTQNIVRSKLEKQKNIFFQQQKFNQIQNEQRKAIQRLKQVEKAKKQFIEQQKLKNILRNQQMINKEINKGQAVYMPKQIQTNKDHQFTIQQNRQAYKDAVTTQQKIDKNRIQFQSNYYDTKYANSHFYRNSATSDKNALTQMIQEKIKKRPIKLTIERKN